MDARHGCVHVHGLGGRINYAGTRPPRRCCICMYMLRHWKQELDSARWIPRGENLSMQELGIRQCSELTAKIDVARGGVKIDRAKALWVSI